MILCNYEGFGGCETYPGPEIVINLIDECDKSTTIIQEIKATSNTKLTFGVDFEETLTINSTLNIEESYENRTDLCGPYTYAIEPVVSFLSIIASTVCYKQ